MGTLLLIFVFASAASVMLTFAVRRIALRWGVVDAPDGHRKLHRGRVPLWGGVAVYLAAILAMQAARYGAFGTGTHLDSLIGVVAVAAGLMCFVGCIDDAYRLGSKAKLLLQAVAILPVLAAGHTVERITVFGATLELGWFGAVLAACWLLGCINAINLLDGMDGLASIVGISTALTMGVIASISGSPHVAVVAVALAGALAGFLVHNLPPARIFLGDSGSMVIGLIVGLLGIQGTVKTTAALSITAPLVVMTLPMFDTALAIVRRKLTGRRFDSADRLHMHHRLLDRGMNPWVVLGILGSLCLLTGVAATIGTILRSDAVAWVTTAVVLLLGIRLRLFGYHEMSLLVGWCARALADAARRLGHGRIGAQLPSPAELAESSFDEAWAILIESALQWNVKRLSLRLSVGNDLREERVWDGLAANSGDAECAVVVTSRRRDGRACEVRAGGFEATTSEWIDHAGVAQLLSRFAESFVERLESRPSRLSTRNVEEAAVNVAARERRAA